MLLIQVVIVMFAVMVGIFHKNMDNDKAQEYISDALNDCGCYEVGDFCYDREGNPTHPSGEKCNQ